MKTRWLSVLFVYCGCFLPNTSYANEFSIPETSIQADKTYKISEALESWNKKQKIALQNHQLIPIDYLEKSSDIKGLIINHQLGTGKTLLSIGFAERNPDRAVIILAPDFLHGHWWAELEKYGVKDKKRYRFFGHNECQLLAKEDLSNAIVIIDEAHRFIQKLRLQSGRYDGPYARIYFNLRKVHRILALSGTPVYNDMFDLLYLVNLVAGKDIFPFNHEQFRLALSKINAFTAYWRGHLLASQYIPPALVGLLSGFAAYYWGIDSILVSYPAGIVAALAPVFLPIQEFPGRVYDISKLKGIIQRYISYYNFDTDVRFYPNTSLYLQKIAYSRTQLNFLYNFYDSILQNNSFKQLLKDHPTLGEFSSRVEENKSVEVNSSAIQDAYKITPGAGREIGNLIFSHFEKDGTKRTIIPDKFKKILSAIEDVDGPVVVYSHYYYNGLLYFKQFLDAAGYKGRYRVFHPEMSKEAHTEITNDFNNGKAKILLLHPDITEGISLKGVRQMHFLDVPISNSLKNQIIGRAVRYQSHAHLPENQRRVAVYIWEHHISMFDKDANVLLRKNWHHNFAEFNYYHGFGVGRQEVDANAWSKTTSPDTRAYRALSILNKYTDAFQLYMSAFSIENTFYSKA